MRIASVGHAVFAALMIGVGIQGLITGEFTRYGSRSPEVCRDAEVLAYLCALLSLASGIGLLWRRTAALAARVLLGSLVVWPLVWRVPRPLHRVPDGRFLESARHPGDDGEPPGCSLRGSLPTGTGSTSASPPARGAAHRAGPLRPWHDPLRLRPLRQRQRDRRAGAGLASVASGLGVFHRRYVRRGGRGDAHRRVCTAGSRALDFADGPLPLLVWVPILAAGSLSAFQRMEVATNLALIAAGWVVADSFSEPRPQLPRCAANDWLSAFVPAAEPRW